MKPKKDPIKPSKVLNKKPNFKKEKLEDEFIKVSLAGLYGQFRSPGVFTRETDISQWDVSQVTDMSTMFAQDIFIPQRETEVVGIEQMRTQQEVENLYGQLGHPIGISSRQSEASTWVTLNKKKTRWERVKDYFSSIYKRWRHVE